MILLSDGLENFLHEVLLLCTNVSLPDFNFSLSLVYLTILHSLRLVIDSSCRYYYRLISPIFIMFLLSINVHITISSVFFWCLVIGSSSPCVLKYRFMIIYLCRSIFSYYLVLLTQTVTLRSNLVYRFIV